MANRLDGSRLRGLGVGSVLAFGLKLGGGIVLGGVAIAPHASAGMVKMAQTSSPPLETAKLGTVEVTLDPGGGETALCRAEPTLTIQRQGKALLSGAISNVGRFGGDGTVGLCRVSDLVVRDLDGDREPEVMVSNFSGGAHCCLSALIYRYDAKSQSYQRSEQFWGNGGASLEDLDRDGKPEFVSRDDRFAYGFSSYAGSAYPTQIWRYQQGQMIDVTRQYPKRVYDDAFRLWNDVKRVKTELEDLPAIDQDLGEDRTSLSVVKARLAAYMADKYMLGQGADGWKRLEQAYPWRDRPQFVADLKDFLQETGYITGSFSRRITFLPDSTFGSAGGRLLPGDRHRYALNARAGQTLELTLSTSGKAKVQVLTPKGKLLVVLGQAPGNPMFKKTIQQALPESGDYLLEVTAPTESGYSMWVEIP